MRLLLVNPIITVEVTERMAGVARAAASPGTEIVAATARFGTQYVENRVEATFAAHAVLEALAEHGAGADAALVAAFGDPGVAAAKEMLDIPVLGISEAALLVAWTQARRFAIVCMTPRLAVWYRECADEHGLAGRLAAVRPLDRPVRDIRRAKEELAAPLLAECLKAVAEDGAEAVILGGGPLAGLAAELADRVPVPLLDGVACGVRLAEALAGLGLRPPRRGSFARPEAKPAQGLAPALTRPPGQPGPA